MTQLYVLSNQYLELADKLSSLDLDAQTIADTIESSGIGDELAIKAQGIEYVARGAEAHHGAIDAEITRLQALKAQRQRTADGLRAYLKTSMEHAGIYKIECPFFKISIKQNPPSVEITDQLSLRNEYWRTPEPKLYVSVPDKAAIKKALQSGVDVIGARLTQSTRIDIQ